MSTRTDPTRTCHVDCGTGPDLTGWVMAISDGSGTYRYEILGVTCATSVDVGPAVRRRRVLDWRRALAALAALVWALLAAWVALG